MKEKIWLTNVNYLWLPLNTSKLLVFCIDMYVCTISKVIGISEEQENVLETSNT